MTPVEMPKANENLTEATLEHWLVKEGDAVAKDQPLCTIITDKATFELPSPEAGTVRKLFGEQRSVLPVGYILCALGTPGEAVPAEYEMRNARTLEAHRGAVTAVNPGSAGSAAVQGAAAGRVRATPAARRAAKEAGVELEAIAAALNLAGPVNEKDVQTYLEKHRPA